jgi:hypothetical protein
MLAWRGGEMVTGNRRWRLAASAKWTSACMTIQTTRASMSSCTEGTSTCSEACPDWPSPIAQFPWSR